MKRILVVLTNQATYGHKNEATGLWLGEATEFVEEVTKKGYKVDYVSPRGGYVPLDPRSMSYAKDGDFIIYQKEEFQERALSRSLKPSQVNAKDYCAIYYTGGHGVMWDFPHNEALQLLTRDIYEQGGYVTSVCHGIAGLLHVKTSERKYLIEGKRITGFTTTEELLSGKKSVVPFSNHKVAKQHHAVFVKKRFFKSYVVKDDRLITGQNPQSARAVALKLLKSL